MTMIKQVVPTMVIAVALLACRNSACDKAADAYEKYDKPYSQQRLDRFDPTGSVPIEQRSELDRRLAQARGFKTGAEIDRGKLEAEVKKQRFPRDWVVDNCKHASSPDRKAEFACLTAAKSLDDYARCREGKEPLEIHPP